LIVRIAVLDRYILAVDEACFPEALAERGHEMRESLRASAAQEANHRHSRLLRARRERPGRGRAAEQRDELASFQSMELHSIPECKTITPSLASRRIRVFRRRGSSGW
jgi:hypothetical protein